MSDLELAVTPIFQPALHYELQPRNLKVPELKKHVNTKLKESELERIFLKWLNYRIQSWSGAFDESYHNDPDYAHKLLLNKKFSVDKIHGLLILHQNHPYIEEAGYFLSAVYNNSKEKVIFYDLALETFVYYLGHKLSEKKVLIANKNTGSISGFGDYSNGVVIAAGDTNIKDNVGFNAKGVAIACENSNINGLGAYSTGIMIAYENAIINNSIGFESSGIIIIGKNVTGKIKGNNGLIIDLRKRNFPKLEHYLDNLCAKFKGTQEKVRKNLSIFQPNPREAIERDIKDILSRGGYTCKI